MGTRRNCHIISGGTVSWITSHLALAAPAYGMVGEMIYDECRDKGYFDGMYLHSTKMAGGHLETPEDVEKLIDKLIGNPDCRVVFMPVAMVDYQVVGGTKYGKRLTSRDGNVNLELVPNEKIIKKVRAERKDIFLVGFKHTCGADRLSQYRSALGLCKEASCNLVVSNDSETRFNMIVCPEEAMYAEGTDRKLVVKTVCEMAHLRSQLRFTRSTVVDGSLVPWDSDLVPTSLRTVVDWLRFHGAYKAFNGATPGHFACKLSDTEFLTSIRGDNYNNLKHLVKVRVDGPDCVIAMGAKPSVGGQSQRRVFTDHPEMDCIVHFHFHDNVSIAVRQQYPFECGSHECGQNTSDGLCLYGNLKAVHLVNHGPNIVFNRNIDPVEVIDFIKLHYGIGVKNECVYAS